MGIWDSIRETTLGTIGDVWDDTQDDVTDYLSEEVRKRIGATAPPEPETPVQQIQAAAQNPLTYVFIALAGLAAFVIFGRK